MPTGGRAAPAAADGSRGADMACLGLYASSELVEYIHKGYHYGGALYSGLCSKRVCVVLHTVTFYLRQPFTLNTRERLRTYLSV